MQSLQRPAGLPSNPRPNRVAYSAQNTSYNNNNNPTPETSTRSRSKLLAPGPSSLHARSRSQPPRAQVLPTNSPSPSSPARPSNNKAKYANSTPRSRSQSRARLTPRTSQDGRQSSDAPTSRSGAPNPLSRSSTPDGPDIRPEARQAKINESSGDGYAIWNTVSTVASALTISVSKAWNSNITTYAGEETPPGQESHLTRAMKAYHIAKARDMSDLPDWLFDERERQAADAQAQSLDDYAHQAQTSTPQDIGGLNKTPPERLGSVPRPREPDPGQPRLRGTDRLKAMRDAKRNGQGSEASFKNSTNDNRQPHPPEVSERQPRIGLPSGPQRGRR